MQFQDWMFDKRVLRRNLRRNLLTREDYERFISSLPDAADNIASPDDINDALISFDGDDNDGYPDSFASVDEKVEPEDFALDHSDNIEDDDEDDDLLSEETDDEDEDEETDEPVDEPYDE